MMLMCQFIAPDQLVAHDDEGEHRADHQEHCYQERLLVQ